MYYIPLMHVGDTINDLLEKEDCLSLSDWILWDDSLKELSPCHPEKSLPSRNIISHKVTDPDMQF